MRNTMMLSICLGLVLLFPVQCFGQGPARGTYRVPQMNPLSQDGTALRAAPGAANPLVPPGGLPSAFHGDWKSEAFWQGLPLDPSTVALEPLPNWDFKDRVGDTRRKFDRYLITLVYGKDTYIFLRFDMNRVVTSQALLTAADGYLPSDLYGQMATVSGGPILSAKAMLKMFFTVSLGKDGNRETGSAYNFSIVQFNDFVLSGYEQNTAYLGTCKFLKLTVPTNQLRYPTRPLSGAPTPAWNMIVLKSNLTSLRDPDTLRPLVDNQPINFLFDAELQYKAMAPIMLVHGTNANPGTWNEPAGDSFNNYLETFNGIFFNDIALKPNGSIKGNGTMLDFEIAKRLISVGAKQCHIISHSKGGLDSRSMISGHYDKGWNTPLDQLGNFEVLSLYTLDTPHRGTVLSDISWNTQNNPDLRADPNWWDLVRLMGFDFGFLHNPPPGDPDGQTQWAFGMMTGAPGSHALAAQKTENMNNYNITNPFNFDSANTDGRPIKFYNTAGDADWNIRNGSIDSVENKFSSWPTGFLATNAYRMLYWAKQVSTRTSTRPVLVGEYFYIDIPVTELYVPDDQRGAQWNDLVVNIFSAVYDGGAFFPLYGIPNSNGIILGNHSAVKTQSLLRAIILSIKDDWKVQIP